VVLVLGLERTERALEVGHILPAKQECDLEERQLTRRQQLSGRKEQESRVVARGAIDPTSRELVEERLDGLADLAAQFRRRDMDSSPPQKIELPGGVLVDLARLEVHRDGQVVPLTPREGDILEYLIRHRDRVVTREDLLLDVWHYRNANVETRTVDIHIVGLRRKVEPDPAKPTLIQTVRGKGYRWYA